MLENIPRELRERPNFVVWRYEQRPNAPKPTKPPYNPASGWPANVTDPRTWATYDDAVKRLQYVNGTTWDGIGYVISSDDPFTFIDLDTHDPKLSDDDRARHARIADTFKGYAEISPSGHGLHLIVRGKVPSGRRRGGVEIYSGERYMTLTGNVWRPGEIIEQQALLDILYKELGGDNAEIYSAVDTAQTEPDNAICDRAANAINGAKFLALYQGHWQAEYPSQSEADFALIDILGFYTQNREQIKRIFRASALGKRDKAKREAYLNSMIVRSFDHQPPQIDLTKLKANLDDELSRRLAESTLISKLPAPTESIVTIPSPDATGDHPVALHSEPSAEPADEVYSLPAGLLGEIAHYVYTSAPRPVREVALCAAIGLMGGICGRSYNVNGTGLNHYVLLLAPTGSGKEQIATGISTIMQAVCKSVPAAADFIGPADIRSDVALVKYLAKKSPSFVTVGGEFGHTLAQMSSQMNNTNMRAIKRVMLDLYGKSGQGSVMMPSIYSDAEKSTLAVRSPSFTFIGESAPEPFYESIDERLISDGLLPRFTLIEYNGKRPDLNEWSGAPPPAQLIERLAAVCAQSLMLNKADRVIDVQYEPQAREMLDSFDKHCTGLINDHGAREVTRHIWNRAHLRALKMAALVSVGINPFQPIITVAAARWAIRLSELNTRKLLLKFDSGEVGAIHGDANQLREMLRMADQWVTRPYEQISMYLPNVKHLHEARIIPHSYLSRRCVPLAAFKNDRLGSTNALKKCLQSALDSGLLTELNRTSLAESHNFGGKCYVIANYSHVQGLL